MLIASGTAHAQREKPHWDTKLEQAIGKPVVWSLRGASGVDTDPLLLRWVQQIGANVAAVAPRQDIAYSFEILSTDTTNAITTPGGTIFVTRGLLDSVDSDDELASVLAHECGHVSKKHALRQIGANLTFIILLNLLSGKRYDKVRTAATLLNVLATLGRSRIFETQADDEGVKYADAAGYNAAGLVRFLESINNGRESRLEEYFDTHPSSQARIDRQSKSPYVRHSDAAERERIALRYEERGLPQAAARMRAGQDPLAPPPLPLFTLRGAMAKDRFDVTEAADKIRGSLTNAYHADTVSGVLQSLLLINSQTNDIRWLYLAARAYAVQTNVNDIYARTLRTARTVAPTYDGLARYANAAPGSDDAANSAAGRNELRQAVERLRGAPTPITRAANSVAAVLVDLNNRFLTVHGNAAWLRYGTLEGILRYAESELARADKMSGEAWRLVSMARIRWYEARLNELIPADDAERRALWQKLIVFRFGAWVRQNADGPTGSASVRAALGVELNTADVNLEAGRNNRLWADWVLEKDGTPENVATALRLLTLDLERELNRDSNR